MGGLIIYHNLTLVQKNWPLKKIANVFGNQLKGANYAGCKNIFMVKHLAHVWPFLKATGDKLVRHSQISFKSWQNNVGSELRFFSLKINVMVAIPSPHYFTSF